MKDRLNLVRYGGIILGSGVNDESVFQEGKSQESIGRSRSVFSTPTIPTGNQVTKSINKPHYPKSFGNCGVVLNSDFNMKIFLPILSILLIISCSKEVPLEQLVLRDGTFYLINSNEPFSGITASYYDNGQLESKGKFKDGEPDGVWEYFHENGQFKSKGIYVDGKQNGIREIYHENGQLEQRGELKDGQLHGLLEEYFVNGQLKEKRNYKDGELHGFRECYWQNGQLKFKGNYTEGNREEFFESYFENGRYNRRGSSDC